MKFLKALFVLALVVTFAVPAFAETQNVKVSGSIDAYWFYRSNWDLRDSNDEGVTPKHQFSDFPPVSGTSHDSDFEERSEADDYFFTLTQVEVSADLTDNVSVVINLLNQRDWNTPDEDEDDDFTADGEDEFNVQLDLAYVQMREIFYSPLTLTIGRQDLWFGRGLVIGSNWRSWDNQTVDDFEGKIQADEYSGKTAFDAIRATLDFNPWTLDFVYSKIDENTHNAEDDIDLYVVNVNYKFSEYNAVAEVYWVTENDRGTIPTVDDTDETGATRNNDTHTIGGRVQFDPISQITLGGELAYQFGHYRSPFDNASGVPGAEFNPERDRSAWMFDVFGTYRWDMTWKPELTIEYVHFSGEENLESNTADDYNAWNSLYRGKFYTAYADFREFIYKTGDPVDQSALQNEQFIQFKGSMKPLQDLLIEASWTYLWTDEDAHIRKQGSSGDPNTVSGSPTRDSELGWEVDLQVTYDYTEDVSFSSLFSVFVPGDFYDGAQGQDSGGSDFDPEGIRGPSDDNAWSVVNSVKVTF
jgi:hypothetical protein